MSQSDASLARIQEELARAVKATAEALSEHPGASAFGDDADVTQTDAAIVASAMLKALDIEIFELAMWQSWGTPSAHASGVVPTHRSPTVSSPGA